MKKLHLILLLTLATLSATAQTIGEAFYIYRNDGQINGFLRGEIDSIAYSHYSEDSLYYDDFVTQIVYTPDSIFQIPLAAIDSVGFVTPKTEYKPGVIDLSEELMPYIVGCDSLTISFSNSMPADLLPKVGDKLMTLEMNDLFPIGFAGEVVQSSQGRVECERVPLEDIFETYYDVRSAYGYIEDEGDGGSRLKIEPINKTWTRNFKMNTITIPFSSEVSLAIVPNRDLAFKRGNEFSVEITPTFHVRSTLIINRHEGTYFSAIVTCNANIKEKMGIFGGLEWSHDFLDNQKIEEPIGPYVNFLFNPGLFLRVSAIASLSVVFEQNYKLHWGRDWSSKGKNALKPSCGGRLKSWDIDVEGCVDGSIGTGAYVEVGVSLLHSELDKFVFRGEIGGEFVGHGVIYNSDIANVSAETRGYERLKNSSFDVNAFASSALQVQLLGGFIGGGISLPFNLSYPLKTWDMVPTFSNTTFKQCLSPQNSADACSDVSGNCLFPVKVGLSVRGEDGAEVDDFYANNKFKNGNKQLSYTFKGLNVNNNYTLYPKVHFCGLELLASPSAEMEKTVFPVTLSGFRVTNAQHQDGGFSHNGQAYDYSYDVTVTATLDADAEGIAEWGYIYLDPNGDEARIPLSQFGHSYTDSRYAYYRNAPHATCTLYGYVRYEGSNDIVRGERHDFPLDYQGETSCPDANHPHWIDLGLPSGTQWRCCNEGAFTPEAYGGYYQFGQVGSAPSLDQIKELLQYCSYTWTTLNGVNGGKFTGPNGGTIFLPAAGSRYYGELYGVGSCGYYWSSAPLDEYSAYYLYIDGGNADWDRSSRDGELSVRPVRQN